MDSCFQSRWQKCNIAEAWGTFEFDNGDNVEEHWQNLLKIDIALCSKVLIMFMILKLECEGNTNQGLVRVPQKY